MARQTRWVAVGLVLMGILGTSGVASADDAVITVHVEDYARVPAEDWTVVQREVAQIYETAGVTVTWAGPLRTPQHQWPRDGVRRVALVIVNIEVPFAGDPRDTADVVGRAAAEYSRAWVFANRVTEAARTGAVDANVLLARVIAHEIGHLLLPNQKHAARGIMRASLEREQVGFFGFTLEQAAFIRAGIQRLRATHAQR
jgi:hypothetical protein